MKRATVVQFKILKNLQNPPHNRIKPSVVLCVYSVYLCVTIENIQVYVSQFILNRIQ
jgi:hypothetical protein